MSSILVYLVPPVNNLKAELMDFWAIFLQSSLQPQTDRQYVKLDRMTASNTTFLVFQSMMSMSNFNFSTLVFTVATTILACFPKP